MSSTVLMHFSDGSTVNDADAWVRISPEQQEKITSVERVVGSRHLTILKSPLLANFFAIVDAYEDMDFFSGKGSGAISLMSIGCHLKDSQPLTRIMFSIDPRTMHILFRAEHVKSFDARGFAPRLRSTPSIRNEVTKVLDNGQWTVINELPVRNVWEEVDALACTIDLNDKKRAVARIIPKGTSCQLLVTPEG